MKKLILTLLLLLLTINAYAFSVSIDPPSINSKAKPGAIASNQITVENTAKEPIILKVYLEDWEYQEDGSKKFFKLGTTPYSLKNYAKLYVKELRLAPGAKENVQVDITSPTDKTGGLYGVVLFEASPVLVNKSANVKLIGRIGTILYHEIDGTQTYNFDVAYLKNSQGSGRSQLLFNFINKSNIHLKLTGSLLILGKNHAIADRIEVVLKALPNSEQKIILNSTKKLLPGEYSALFSLNYLEDKSFNKEVKVNITK